MKQKLSHNYETSKDYNRLFQLIQKHRIVCFVDSKREPDENGYMLQEICQSAVINGNNVANIGSRGVGYINALANKYSTVLEDFVERCKYSNLEFIDLPEE